MNGLRVADDKASLHNQQTDSPAVAVTPVANGSPASVPDSMDAIIEGLLLAGLHELDDDSLPIQTNEFYSKTVLGCKPAGMPLVLQVCPKQWF